MTNLKSEYNYCSFIDVLGYGNIVSSPEYSNETKIEILESIYMNLFGSISFTIKEINKNLQNKIYIKSFSDSVYLASAEPMPLLFTLYNIYNFTFGYNKNLNNYTPLLRSGVVRDWTLKVMDIASLTRQDINSMYENDEFSNIIGLGVARSYSVSEKSYLSGMRIIISPEVINNIEIHEYKEVPFECYYINCKNYLYRSDSKIPEDIRLFILPVTKNENNVDTNLYELAWPVFKYSWSEKQSDIDVHIQELINMKSNFTQNNIRHLKKTAELLYNSLLITKSLNQSFYSDKYINTALIELKNTINADPL